MERFIHWEACIERLDEGDFDVSKKEADFLDDLLDRRPTYLTEKQVEWLKDMEEKYL